jgi:tetratricopeptide (TPR) repeat protein
MVRRSSFFAALVTLSLIGCSREADRQIRTADALIRQGFTNVNAGRYSNAIGDFTRAIQVKSDAFYAYAGRARAEYELRELHASLADMDQIIEFAPKNPDALLFRGQIKSDMLDFPGAILDYTTALRLNPDLALAYHNRGCVKSLMDDYAGALVDYDKAIMLNRINDMFFWNRGTAKAKLGDYRGAISDFKSAVRLNPTNEEARAELQLAEQALSFQTNAPGGK